MLVLLLMLYVHVPITLYANCDFNNILCYMLLQLQLKQTVEGLLNATLWG